MVFSIFYVFFALIYLTCKGVGYKIGQNEEERLRAERNSIKYEYKHMESETGKYLKVLAAEVDSGDFSSYELISDEMLSVFGYDWRDILFMKGHDIRNNVGNTILFTPINYGNCIPIKLATFLLFAKKGLIVFYDGAPAYLPTFCLPDKGVPLNRDCSSHRFNMTREEYDTIVAYINYEMRKQFRLLYVGRDLVRAPQRREPTF